MLNKISSPVVDLKAIKTKAAAPGKVRAASKQQYFKQHSTLSNRPNKSGRSQNNGQAGNAFYRALFGGKNMRDE